MRQRARHPHPIVRINYPIRYPIRVFSGAIVLVAIASALYERGSTPIAWALLVLHGLAWPHVAFLNATRGRNTKNAELTNLLGDAAFVGVWTGLIGFSLWPSTLLTLALIISTLSVAGLAFTGVAAA